MTTPAGSIRLASKRANSRGQPPQPGESIVSIDRTNPVLGNRHILHNHRDSTEREIVIRLYEQDLVEDERVNGPMTKAIGRIADRVLAGERVVLMCWCFPEADCHGRHIVTRVNRLIAEAT